MRRWTIAATLTAAGVLFILPTSARSDVSFTLAQVVQGEGTHTGGNSGGGSGVNSGGTSGINGGSSSGVSAPSLRGSLGTSGHAPVVITPSPSEESSDLPDHHGDATPLPTTSTPDETPVPPSSSAADDATASPSPSLPDAGHFPWVPVGIGALVLIAIAWLSRRRR
jgi:hypothetical protein